MDIHLPSHLSITDSEVKLLRFAEEEYAYYDGIPSADPDHITPVDVMVTNAVNSRLDTADKIRNVHRGLAKECDPILAKISQDAHLLDEPFNEDSIAELFEAACCVPDVLLSRATKVLHRKRPHLIPMLDNVVLTHYVGGAEVARAQDKGRAPQVGMEALTGFRADLRACQPALRDILHPIGGRFPLSEVRALEALVWMETEPNGYYRDYCRRKPKRTVPGNFYLFRRVRGSPFDVLRANGAISTGPRSSGRLTEVAGVCANRWPARRHGLPVTLSPRRRRGRQAASQSAAPGRRSRRAR